jgi:hypothetical protein
MYSYPLVNTKGAALIGTLETSTSKSTRGTILGSVDGPISYGPDLAICLDPRPLTTWDAPSPFLRFSGRHQSHTERSCHRSPQVQQDYIQLGHGGANLIRESLEAVEQTRCRDPRGHCPISANLRTRLLSWPAECWELWASGTVIGKHLFADLSSTDEVILFSKVVRLNRSEK